MAELLVPEHQRVPREAVLLGDITITAYDCNGVPVEVHGLTANDLVVKNANGTTTPLLVYITQEGVCLLYTSAQATVTSEVRNLLAILALKLKFWFNCLIRLEVNVVSFSILMLPCPSKGV